MPKIVDRDEMRNQIAQGAMRSFIERGIHGSRMDHIARAAGIGKGTVYLYFSNKDEICEHLVEQHFAKLESTLFIGPLAENLEQFLSEVETTMRPVPEHVQSIPVFFEVFGPNFGSKTFRRRVSLFFDRMGRRYQVQLEQLQSKGLVRADLNARQYGRALCAMVDGLILHRGLFGISAKRQKQMVEHTLLVMRQGLAL